MKGVTMSTQYDQMSVKRKSSKKKPIIIGVIVLIVAAAIVVGVVMFLKLSTPNYNLTINNITKSSGSSLGSPKITSSSTTAGVKDIVAEIDIDCNLTKADDNSMNCDTAQISGSYDNDKDVSVSVSSNAQNIEANDGKISFSSKNINIAQTSIAETSSQSTDSEKYVITMRDNKANKDVLVYNLTINTQFSAADNKLINDNAKPLEFSGSGAFVSDNIHFNAGSYKVTYSAVAPYDGGHYLNLVFKDDSQFSQDVSGSGYYGATTFTGSQILSIPSDGDYRFSISDSSSILGNWTVTITK